MPKHPVYDYESRKGEPKRFRSENPKEKGRAVDQNEKGIMFDSDYLKRRNKKAHDEFFEGENLFQGPAYFREKAKRRDSFDEALDTRDKLNRDFINKAADTRMEYSRYEKKKKGKKNLDAKDQAAALKGK